jgi:hypothetical protein
MDVGDTKLQYINPAICFMLVVVHDCPVLPQPITCCASLFLLRLHRRCAVLHCICMHCLSCMCVFELYVSIMS